MYSYGRPTPHTSQPLHLSLLHYRWPNSYRLYQKGFGVLSKPKNIPLFTLSSLSVQTSPNLSPPSFRQLPLADTVHTGSSASVAQSLSYAPRLSNHFYSRYPPDKPLPALAIALPQYILLCRYCIHRSVPLHPL